MSKTLKIVLISVAGLLLIGYLTGIRVYYDRFLPRSYLHGENISGMTESEAVSAILESKSDSFTVNELDGNSEAIDFSAIDYAADYEGLVKDMKESQSCLAWPFALFSKHESESAGKITFDEAKLQTAVHNLSAVSGENIVAPTNAYIGYEDGKYSIVSENDGNTLDEAKTLQVISEALSADKTSVDLSEEGCYLKAEVRSDDKELNETMNQLESINFETITVNVVSKEEILKATDIINMIDFTDKENPTVIEDKLNEYIDGLADKYNTLYRSRPFKTTSGTTVEVGGSSDTYGYSMSKEETYNRLSEALLKFEDSTVDAAWDLSGGYRSDNGSDIGNTYVEVSISAQHLWYYKSGELVLETDVVTGLTNGKRNTPTGVFKIWSKERNATLKGEDYETPVSYWMPFTWTGVGFHDANWRGSFGGSIYTYNGSHGCVNMPPAKAAELFEAVELYTPVVVY